MSDFLEVNHDRYAADILVYLTRNGSATKMNLYRNISINPSMPEKLARLEKAGLVEMRLTDAHNLASGTTVSLTHKGFTVGSCLVDAEEAMKA